MTTKIYALFFLLLPLSMAAQTVSGQVVDEAGQSLVGASIALMRLRDSSTLNTVQTDLSGNFSLEMARRGRFLLKISYIGYTDLWVNGARSEEPLLLGKLVLKSATTTFKEVEVKATQVAVQQKGDTTQFNANAFKTNPDATSEDLIAKMPGISVQDGKVQAQGEDVKKVLVDGKEFFGDDANAVLKNLPAEVVDKIQVFDKKSEQSELTGFDDGNTTKTINIVTKLQFRNGTFGKAMGGYGYQDKWKAGLNLNFFKEKQRITILVNSNNINDQNFSTEDLLGVMSGESGRQGQGGFGGGRRGGGRQGGFGGGQESNANNFLIAQKNGITTTQAIGLNYTDVWRKVTFTGSYFLNYTDNKSENSLFRQYIANDNTGIMYNESTENGSKNTNHRAQLKFDWRIDPNNALIIQPKISVQQNNGTSVLSGTNTLLTTVLSNTGSNFGSNLIGMNVSAPITYRHSFEKKGRSFSASLTPSYNQNKGDNNLRSKTAYWDSSPEIDSLNQLGTRNVQGFGIASTLVYTEPVSEKSILLFNYTINNTKNDSDKETFNYTAATNAYSSLDTLLSNKFNSRYTTHAVGAYYRYVQEKWHLMTGIAYQYAALENEQAFPTPFNLSKSFNSVLPIMRFQYKFNPKQNLRIDYRSSNNAPSVSQLQNVINNSNPLLLSTGNPDLKQDWQNTLNIRYAATNSETNNSFFALLSGTYTKDYIVNSTFIAPSNTIISPEITLAKGSQLVRPINLDGYFTVRSFNNYSLPIKAIKSNLSLNLGGTYSRTPGLINDALNNADSYNAGLGLVLASNVSEKVDFTVSSNTTFNAIENSLQTNLNSRFYNQNTRLKLQVMPWKGLVLQTDLSHQYNSGLSAAFNQNYLLWNAAIGYKFLENNQAEVRLSVFDILKQNNSITRNTTETYYEDVRTNVLQQYFLLQFTYNIKAFKAPAK